MELENLLLKKEDGVAVVTFNRPEAMNALTMPMHKVLEALFTSFRDDASYRAVVAMGADQD